MEFKTKNRQEQLYAGISETVNRRAAENIYKIQRFLLRKLLTVENFWWDASWEKRQSLPIQEYNREKLPHILQKFTG